MYNVYLTDNLPIQTVLACKLQAEVLSESGNCFIRECLMNTYDIINIVRVTESLKFWLNFTTYDRLDGMQRTGIKMACWYKSNNHGQFMVAFTVSVLVTGLLFGQNNTFDLFWAIAIWVIAIWLLERRLSYKYLYENKTSFTPIFVNLS